MKSFNELITTVSLNVDELVDEYLTTEDPGQRDLLEGMIGNTRMIAEEDNPYNSNEIAGGFKQKSLSAVFADYSSDDYRNLIRRAAQSYSVRNPDQTEFLDYIARAAGGRVVDGVYYFK